MQLPWSWYITHKFINGLIAPVFELNSMIRLKQIIIIKVFYFVSLLSKYDYYQTRLNLVFIKCDETLCKHLWDTLLKKIPSSKEHRIVIMSSNPVKLSIFFSKLVIITREEMKIPPPTRKKQCIPWTIGFAVLLVKIRYIILYLGAAERRSESEKII